MKPNVWKIVVLFVLAFVTIAAPVIVVVLLGMFGPPPYLFHEERMGLEWSLPQSYPDGSTVSVHRYSDAAAAKAGMDRLLNAISWSSLSKTFNLVRYTSKSDGTHGLLLPVENRIVQIEAADDRAIDQRLKSLPFISENPHKSFVWEMGTQHAVAMWLGIAVFVVLWFFFVNRGATWAASVAPATGVTPAPAEALRTRLLAINDLDLPFHLREQPGGRLVAEWRIADAKWTGILQSGGLRISHQVLMQMDPGSHKVKIVERHRAATWSGDVGGTGGSFSFFQGITFFQYEQGIEAGLCFKHGRWTTTAHQYGYSLAEMKNPLIEAIVGSGWTFAPVVMFLRHPRN